jgi:hypothetical protein
LRTAKQARLAYFRNVQQSGKWMTRIVLPLHGTQVTLVETRVQDKKDMVFTLQEIIVEPTKDNRL